MPALQRRPGLPTFLFLSELLNIGLENIPPVTLSLIAIQFLIYFGILDDFHNFDAGNVCIGYNTIWKHGEFWRLLTGSLVHLDEWHLYFNMASLLWKGTRLERRRFSSTYYLCLILAFIPLCGLGTVVLDYLLAGWLNDYGRLHTCAAGFSAVIFALKVLASHYDDEHTLYVMNAFPVSSRYACWAELFLIQMVTPNASFTGHLAGIIVGLLYIYKPLKWAVDFMYYGAIAPLLGVTNGHNRRQNNAPSAGWNWWSLFSGGANQHGGTRLGHGPSSPNQGSRYYNQNDSDSRPSAPPYSQYTAGMSEDDQMAWALHESVNQTPTSRRQWAGSAGNRATPPQYGWSVGNNN